MRKMRIVVLAAAALAGAGCHGGDEPVAESQWASAEERSWIRSVVEFDRTLDRGGAALARLLNQDAPPLRPQLVEALTPFLRCRHELQQRVGNAPSARLGSSEQAFRKACAEFRRGAGQLLWGRRHGFRDSAFIPFHRGYQLTAVALGRLPPGRLQQLPAIRGPSDRSRVQPDYGRVLLRVIGKRVEVRCWSSADWTMLLREESVFLNEPPEEIAGLARSGGRRIDLAPEVCYGLDQLRYRHERPLGPARTGERGRAVVTFAHEGFHALGVADEAKAECYAMQRAERAAVLLGVPPDEARRLAEAAWLEYQYLEKKYRSRECRDGGALDLRPETPEFP